MRKEEMYIKFEFLSFQIELEVCSSADFYQENLVATRIKMRVQFSLIYFITYYGVFSLKLFYNEVNFKGNFNMI